MQKNIILTGVGGQGTVLASKLIAAASLAKGYEVMSAETIGMAQKGGSVFSHLRVGEGLYSPMIRKGTADLLLAFEPAEAVRMLPYLRETGTLVVSSHPVMPVTAALLKDRVPGKTVVLTGAMQPALMRETDAHFNVGFAAAAAQLLPEGVYLAMNGRVFEAGKVRKNRAAGRFEIA